MLLKTSFLLPHRFCKVEFEFSWFHNTEQSSEEILFLKREMLLEFQNKTNIKITGFKLMHFGFGLVSSDIDLGNKDFLDAHLNLLDTDIPSKPFVSLQDDLETSSRRHRRNNFLSSKTSSRRLVRCLQNVFEDKKLLRWRRVEDVFKRSWRPTNVCWAIS